MENIVVADKATSQITANAWGDLQLTGPGVVEMPIAPAQVASVSRNGQDLIINLKSGERVNIGNFFATSADGVQSDIVFSGEDGTLWQAQYSNEPFTGFTFAEVSSLDELLAGEGVIEANQTFAFAGLGLLGAGGAAAAASGGGGGGGGGDGAAALPAPPGNLSVSDDGLNLTGTGIPGTTINVRGTDGTLLGSTVVGADGNFSVPLEGIPSNGQQVIVDQTDPNGNTSEGVPVTLPDLTAPAAPSDLALSADGLTLSGNGEPGATVTVRDASGNVLGTAVVAADGTFAVSLDSAQLDGQTLSVEQADAAGNVSPSTGYVAADATAPGVPTNLLVGADGLALTGNGEPGATVTVRSANGTLLGTALVAADGTFNVTLGAAQLDGQTLQVTQADAAGNVSPAASVVAPVGADAPAAPANLALSTDGLTLTGSGEPGATVTVRSTDGRVLGTAVVAADGTFNVELGSPQLDGQALNVVQTNPDGLTSPAASLVAPDATAPAAPGGLQLSADGLVLSGTGEPGARVTVRSADGSVLGTAVVGANGSFSVDLDSAQTAGQVLSVQQTDAAGNVSPVASLTAGDDTAPEAPANLVLADDGLSLTGTGEPGATVTVRDANGDVLGTAVVGANGVFNVTLGTAQLDGQLLSVEQADAAGNVSPTATLVANDLTAPAAPTGLLVSTDGLSLSGLGEPGASVTVRAADGTLLGTALVAADGTFTVELASAQLEGQRLSVEQTDAAGNLSPAATALAPDGADAPEAPSNLALSADGLTLTGNGEPGDTVTVRAVDGNVLGTAVVAANGSFSVTLDSAQLNGETLTVTQTDAAGNTSPSAALTAADLTTPLAPTDLQLSADGLVLTGTGEPGATVTVRTAEGTVLGIAVVSADGRFSVELSSAQLDGQQLSIEQADPAGNVSPSASFTATDVTAPAAPTSLSVSQDGLSLDGSGEPGATVSVRDADGNVLGTAVVAADGTFVVTLDSAQLEGQALTVDQTDAAGNVSPPTSAIAPDGGDAPAAPTNLALSADGLTLTGNGEPGDTVTVRAVDGTVLGTAVVAANGSFSVTLDSAQLNGETLTVTQTDAAGNTSPSGSLTAADLTAPPAPTDLQLSADGLALSGTGEPGATVTVRAADGRVLGSAVVAANGAFSVALDSPLLDGRAVAVEQVDLAGNVSPTVSFSIEDVTAPDAPTNLLVSNDGLTLTGTGEAGATVTVRGADGTVLGTAVVATDGTFSVALATAQLDGQVLSVDQADAAGNVSPSASALAPDGAAAPAVPTDLSLGADGLTLTGNGEAGDTVTVRGADGSVLGTAVVGADGTFTVVLDTAQLNGEALTVVQTNAAGETSPSASLVATDVTAPAAPTDLQLSANGLLLSGAGEPGASVTVRGADGSALGTAQVGADGRFDIRLDRPQLDGQRLTVEQVDQAGNLSPSTTLNAADVTAPQAPTNLLVGSDGLSLSGNGEPGAQVTVRAADGAVLGTAVVNADGTFSVVLSNAQLDGQPLTAEQADAAGNVSPRASAFAPDGADAPEAPTGLALSADGMTLTGTGEPGASVTVRGPDGRVLGAAQVATDGTFSVTLDSAQLDGEALSVVQTDAAGSTSPSASLIAADITAPQAPTNLQLGADGLTVTGTGEAGASVTVRDASGAVLGSATVAADGTFNVALGTAQLDGQRLAVTQADRAGNLSPSASLQVADVTAPLAPSNTQVSNDGLSLSGIGEPGATVTVSTVDGSVLGTALVGADGAFSVTFDTAQLTGQVLTIVQADAAGNISPAVTATAPQSAEAPPAPAGLQLSGDGLILTGTGQPGSSVTVRAADDSVLGTAVVGADGRFSVNLASAQLNGENLQVVQTSADGLDSPSAALTAADVTAPPAPGNLQLSADGLILTGSGEAGATVIVRAADGSALGSAVVAPDGRFSVTLGAAQLDGQALTVEQADRAGNLSPEAPFTAADVTVPQPLSNVQVSNDGLSLSGNGEPGATVTIRGPDGTVLGTAPVAADGTFSVTFASAQLQGQVLSAEQADAAGNVSPVVIAVAPEGAEAPEPASGLQLSADGLTLTGSGEPGTTVTVRGPDGNVLGTALVAVNGTFSVNLAAAQLNGETLSVTLTDANGNSSPSSSLVSADVTAPGAPTDLLVSNDGLTLTGTGEPAATVLVRGTDGVLLGTAVVAADGSFSVRLGAAQLDGQTLDVTQRDTAGNLSAPGSATAPVGADAPAVPTGLQLSADGLTLTGIGESGATVTVRDANGGVLGTTVVAADGTFSLPLNSAQLDGQTLSVVQTDVNGNSSPSVSLTVADVTAPAAPSNLQVSADGTLLTGNGEAGATVTVRGPTGVVLGTALVAADGAFSVSLNATQLGGQTLTVDQVDAAGNLSPSSSALAPVGADAPQAPSDLQLSADGLTLTGAAEAGTTVTVRGQGGTLLGSVVVAADGSFSVPLGTAQLNGETLNVVVADAAGNASPSTALVAADLTAPAAPANLQVSGDGLTLSGTGEPGAAVTVRAADGRVLGMGQVDATGNFSVTLDTAQVDGQLLSVEQADAAGNLSAVSSATAPAGPQAPGVPSGLVVSADGLSLSGTGEAGATVSVRGADGGLLGSAVVAADGRFSVPLATAQLDGQTLTIVQADAAGNASPSTTLTVADITPPAVANGLLVSADGLSLSGTAEPASTVSVTVLGNGGVVLGTAQVAPDGTFTVVLDRAQTDGQTLSVIVTDAAGNRSPVVTTIAPDGAGAPGAPTDLQLSADGLTLTGSGTPGASVSVRGTDGTLLGTGVVAPDGALSVELGSAQLNGQTLNVVLTDAAGNASPSASVLAADLTAPGIATGLLVSSDGLSLTGLGEAGATVTVRGADGTLLGSALVGSDGTFSVTLAPAQVQGQALSVTQADAAGNASAAASTTAPDGPDAPAVPAALQLSADGLTFSGTGEPGASVTVSAADGTVLGSALVDADGTFSVDLDSAQLDGQVLTVTLSNAAGTSPSLTFEASDITAPAAPAQLQFSADGASLSGTAEAGTTIQVRGLGNALLGTAVADAEGNFTVTLLPALDQGQPVNVVALDPAGNASPSTPITAPGTPADTTPPGVALDLAIDASGNILTGRGEIGAQVTVTTTAGVVLGTGLVGSDGLFSVALAPAQDLGQPLNVILTDSFGNASAVASLLAPLLGQPQAPTELAFSNDGQFLSGRATPGLRIYIRSLTGVLLGTAVVAADGTFNVGLDPAQANGDPVDVLVSDASGNLAPVVVLTSPDITPPTPVTALVASPLGNSLAGKGEADATVSVRDQAGTLLGSGTVGADGNFLVSLAPPVAEGTLLSVIQEDGAGLISAEATVTVPDASAPAPATEVTLAADGATVSGTGTAGSTVEVRDGAGNVIGSVVVADDGSFSVPLDTPRTNGEQLDVVLIAPGGEASLPTSITADDTTAPAEPDDLTINPNGVLLSGRGEIGATVTVLDADGAVIGTGQVGPTGSFSVTLDTAQNQAQPLQVTLTDAAGNVSTPAAITAPNVSDPLLPGDLALDPAGTQLSGIGQAGSTVTVRDEAGTLLGSTTVAMDGRFSVPLDSVQNNGQLLQVVATTPAGQSSAPVGFVAPDTLAPDPVLDATLNTARDVLTGTGEPGAQVSVRDNAGTLIGSATVAPDGSFSVTLSPVPAADAPVQVVQADPAGNLSEPVTAAGADLTPPDALINVAISADGSVASGNGEVGATVLVRNAANEVVGTGVVGGNGRFEISLAPVQANGQALTLTQTDAAGNVSPTFAITAPDVQPPAAASGLALAADGVSLSGTGEAGATISVRNGAGDEIGTGVVGADGSFSVTLDEPQLDGQALTVVQIDGGGNESASAPLTAPDSTAPATVANLAVAANGTSLSGTGEPGATVTVTGAGAAVLGSATVAANGSFSVTLVPAQLNGQALSVVQTDASDNPSPAATINAPEVVLAQPSDTAIDATGTLLSGTAQAGATVEVRAADGSLIGSATVPAGGAFEVTLDTPQLDGETLEVVVIGTDGRTSVPLTVTADDVTPPSAATDLQISADGSQVSGSAEPGSIVSVSRAGISLGSVSVDDTGVFVITLAPAAVPGDALSISTRDAAGNEAADVDLAGPTGTEPSAPTGLALSAGGTILTGTATPGSTVTVIGAGNQVLGSSAVVGADGAFSVTLASAQTNGETLFASASLGGQASVPSTLVAADTTAPQAPGTLQVASDGSAVSGHGEPGAQVTVSNAAGSVLGTATVAAGGAFSITLTPAQANGQALTLVQTDAAGNVSGAATVTAPDLQPPEAPTGVAINAAGTVVSGRGEAGATVEVREPGGTLLASGTVDASGNFRVILPQAQLTGAALQVLLVDAGDNASAPVDLATADRTPPAAVTELALSGDGSILLGRGEAGAVVEVRGADGTLIGTATVAANGQFSASLVPAPANGQTIEVTQRDAAGNVSDEVLLSAPDISAPAALTNVAINADGLTVTGKGEPGATVFVRGADGSELGSALVGTNGSFSVTLSTAQINAEILTINQEDPPGNEGPSVTLTAPDRVPPEAPADLAISANGLQVTGRGEAGSTVTVSDAAGRVLGSGVVAGNGQFQITLGQAQVNGQSLDVTARDAAGNASPSAVLVAGDSTAPLAASALTVAADGAALTGLGEPGAEINVINAAGTLLGTATVAANGTFSVALVPAVSPGVVLTVVQSDQAGNDSPPAQVTSPGELAPATPSELALANDGRTLTGSGTPGSSVAVHGQDGQLLGSALVNPDGSFRVLLSPAQLNGQVLTVSASNAEGYGSESAQVTAADVTAPVALTDYRLSVDGLTVSGRGEAGATVTISAADGQDLGTAVVGADGRFSATLRTAQLDGQVLSLTQTDAAGNESPAVTVTAPDRVAPLAPTEVAINPSGTLVSGRGEAGTTVTVSNAAGTVLGTGVVRVDGSFSVSITPPQINGQELDVTLTDAAGNVSPIADATASDSVAPDVLGNLVFNGTGASITGRGEAGATVTARNAFGDVLGTVVVGPTGAFTLTLTPAQTNGEVLELVQVDRGGNASAVASLTAPDSTAPLALQGVVIDAAGSVVSGAGEPGATVTVRSAAGTVLGSAQVLADGTFSVTLDTAQINLQSLQVQQADAQGNLSPATTLSAPDLTPPAAVANLQINAAGTQITGTAEIGAEVRVSLVSAEVIDTVAVNPDGTFTLVLEPALVNGEQLQVVVVDAAGNLSPVSDLSAPDITAPAPVGDLTINAAGNQVTGSGEPGASVEVLLGTTSLGTATVAADGSFTVDLATAQLNGQQLSVIQTDAADNGSPVATVTAPDTTAPAAPAAIALSDSGLTLTGTGEAGARIQVLGPDRTVLGVAQVNADGTFSVDLAGAQLNGEVLSILQVDPAGNFSPTVLFEAADVTAPAAVANLALSVDGLTLVGTGEPSATVSVTSAAGTLGSVQVGTDGRFSVPLNAAQLNGQTLSVVQTDEAGNASSAAELVAADVTAPDQPRITDIQPGYITGVTEAGAIVSVTAGGVPIGTATAGVDGQFAVVFEADQNTGAVLTVTVTDAADNTSQPLLVESLDTTPPGPVTDLRLNTGFTQLSGFGEADATVFVSLNGRQIGTAVVAADGTFVVDLTEQVFTAQLLTVIQRDESDNPSPATTLIVPLAPPPEAPSDLALNETGSVLSGRAPLGTRVEVRSADGSVLLGSATIGADTAFSITLDPPQANGQTLSVTSYLLLGGVGSQATFITADDITPPAALANVAVNSAGTVVTGTGEAGATVIISNSAGVELGRAQVANGGVFSVTLGTAQTNGQVLTAIQVDASANTSPAVQVTAQDTTPPAPASNLVLNAAGTLLTGVGEAGTTVQVTSGNAVIGTGVVAANGTFSIVLSPAQVNGQALGVTLTDAATNASPVASLTAPDTTPPAAPNNLAIVGNGLQLTGNGEAGAIVTVTNAAGNSLGSVRVAADGSFTVLLASAQTNGQVLTVRQADAAGNQSPTVSATASDTTPPALAGNLAVAAGGASLTGTGEAGARVTVTNAAGTVLGTATVGTNGQFTVTLTPAQNDGQLLNVRLADAAQNVSAPATVTAPDTTPPVAPSSALVNASGTLVSGTGIAGDRIVVSSGGSQLGTAVVAANGTWSLALNPPLTNYQALAITQLDPAGNVSPTLTINAPDLTPPAAAGALRLSTDGLTLSGTGEAGATVTVKSATGSVLGTASVAANGTFSVTLASAQINGETLTVNVVDGRGNQSPAATLVAPDVDFDRPVVASDDLKAATVTLAPITTSSTKVETFPTLIGLGFSHTFNFTVASGTTARPTLTLNEGGVLNLNTNATFTLQVKDASGTWQTIGTASANGSLLNLEVLAGSGVRISAGTLQAGEYRLNFASNSLTVVTNIVSNLRLDVTSLTQFQGTAGAAVTGNVLTDIGVDGTADITGPDNGAVLRVQNGGSGYVNAGSGIVVQGLYGTLTINGQGAYSYQANSSASSVGKVDVFNYQLVHPNGLSDTATLYVRIDSPQATEVWNSANLAAPALVVDATNDIASTDITLANLVTTTTTNLGSVTSLVGLGGNGAYNFSVAANTISDLTLTLTSASLASLAGSVNLNLYKLNTATGQYVLVKNWTGGSLISLGGGSQGVVIEDQTPGSYRVTLSVGGLSVISSIGLSVTNVATHTNQFVVGSYTPVTGNLLTDTAGGGADVLGSAFTTLAVLAAGSYVQPGYNGTSVAGTYGTLLVKADGSYTYALNSGLSSTVIGQSDVFTYRLTHPNGTSDTATLTIDLDQAGASGARMAVASVESDDSTFATLAASSGEDALAGTDADDTLDASHAGAVTLDARAGDDTLVVSDLDFVSVAGGSGTDTLLWAGGDAAIDLGSLQDRLSSLEVIDLNADSAVDLTISLEDLVAITDADQDTLLIKGTEQDSVHMSGNWTAEGTQLSDGLTYTQYTPQEDPSHHLWVQNGVQVV